MDRRKGDYSLDSVQSRAVECDDGHVIKHVPIFLIDAFTKVISEHLHEEGLFRREGNANRLKAAPAPYQGNRPLPNGWSVHDVCTAIKRFLRCLKVPLLAGLQEQFLENMRIQSEDVRVRATVQMCYLLPPKHLDCLAYVTRQLQHVCGHAIVDQEQSGSEPRPAAGGNRMSEDAMAKVFAPTIVPDQDATPTPQLHVQAMLEQQQRKSQLVQLLIENAHLIGVQSVHEQLLGARLTTDIKRRDHQGPAVSPGTPQPNRHRALVKADTRRKTVDAFLPASHASSARDFLRTTPVAAGTSRPPPHPKQQKDYSNGHGSGPATPSHKRSVTISNRQGSGRVRVGRVSPSADSRPALMPKHLVVGQKASGAKPSKRRSVGRVFNSIRHFVVSTQPQRTLGVEPAAAAAANRRPSLRTQPRQQPPAHNLSVLYAQPPAQSHTHTANTESSAGGVVQSASVLRYDYAFTPVRSPKHSKSRASLPFPHSQQSLSVVSVHVPSAVGHRNLVVTPVRQSAEPVEHKLDFDYQSPRSAQDNTPGSPAGMTRSSALSVSDDWSVSAGSGHSSLAEGSDRSKTKRRHTTIHSGTPGSAWLNRHRPNTLSSGLQRMHTLVADHRRRTLDVSQSPQPGAAVSACDLSGSLSLRGLEREALHQLDDVLATPVPLSAQAVVEPSVAVTMREQCEHKQHAPLARPCKMVASPASGNNSDVPADGEFSEQNRSSLLEELPPSVQDNSVGPRPSLSFIKQGTVLSMAQRFNQQSQCPTNINQSLVRRRTTVAQQSRTNWARPARPLPPLPVASVVSGAQSGAGDSSRPVAVTASTSMPVVTQQQWKLLNTELSHKMGLQSKCTSSTGGGLCVPVTPTPSSTCAPHKHALKRLSNAQSPRPCSPRLLFAS